MIATFLGEGIWDALVGEPYVEEAVGMTTLRHWTLADAWVFHSEWWLREHWGRAFEVAEIVRPPRLAGWLAADHAQLHRHAQAPGRS